MLILAGAGSGKTRVITYRIAYLIEHMGVMPESILAMTFTNKAAAEMGERVEKLVGGLSIAKPVISTFHSFCVRVLRRDIEALQIPSATPGQPPIGHTQEVRHLRRERPAIGGQVGDEAPRPGRQATHAAHRARAHLLGEESHARSAGTLPAIGRSQDGEDRAPVRGVPQGVAQGQRPRLRRSSARSHAAVEDRQRLCASITTAASNIC